MTNKMRTILYISAVLILTYLPTPAFTQPGTLDNTFGIGGIVKTSQGNFGDKSNSMAIQSDGKILYGGYTQSSFTNSDFALVRCNDDGSLDTSFGIGGKVKTNIENRSEGQSIAIQANGKILLGGYSHWFINLVRYNSNGSLDTNFGTGGKVITDIEGYYSEKCKSLAIKSNGKILLGGYGQENGNDKSYFILAQYNDDGTLDSTFGIGGKVIGRVGKANSMMIQSDGKILLGGSYNFNFALVRYHANGTLDSTFGTGGEIITPVGSSSEGNALSIQSDGKIVLGGYADACFALVRYNNDGTLDNTFGIGGKVIGSPGKANTLTIQSDGKILIGGASNSTIALVRYNVNGTLDSTFGVGGKVITVVDSSSEGNSLRVQSDGKIVLAGYSYNGTKTDMTLLRYDADAVGIEETDSKKLVSRIYPNPFNSSVTVQFNTPLHNAAIIIYSVSGQIAEHITNYSGHEIQLSRKNLKSGIYFLCLKEAYKIIAVEKLVISDN